MFNKLLQIFRSDSKLLKTATPIVFSDNVDYHDKTYYKLSDIKEELFDPKDSKELAFCYYDDISNSTDTPILHDYGYRFDVFVLTAKSFGREFSKTCSFGYENDERNKPALFEILSGEGYVLLEKRSDESKLKLVKVQKGSYVHIPKNYAFVLINTSKTQNFVCLSLISRNAFCKPLLFSKTNGASVFCTKSGFLKNSNCKSSYELEEYTEDYVENMSFNKEKGLYNEIMEVPEKFRFLK